MESEPYAKQMITRAEMYGRISRKEARLMKNEH